MDLPTLSLFCDIAAQAPIPAPVSKLTAIAGLTTLEIILMSACATLSSVIGFLWKSGNDNRKETAGLLEARTVTITKLVTDQTADNKDIVHAIQDVGKTLDRIVTKLDRKNGAP